MDEPELIQSLIIETNNLPLRDILKRDALLRRTTMVISNIYGSSSDYVKDINNINFYPGSAGPEKLYDTAWKLGQGFLLNILNTIMEERELFSTSKQKGLTQKSDKRSTKQVFIVHGHDELMKQTVARILEKIGLEPIILHEKPNKGRTIIEKFEDHSNVGFAVVLLSADDLAYTRMGSPKDAKLRARQNVIFELGFFMGLLGRSRVAVLHTTETNFELPSDYEGVLYIPYDSSEKWKASLMKELKVAGYSVDMNNLI